MRNEYGGAPSESIFFVLLIIILMFALANGTLFNGGNKATVIHSPYVTQQVPASGNLTPQPDYHQND